MADRGKIIVVSEESYLAGYYRCGIGEVVDSIVHTLSDGYDVTLLTPGAPGTGRGLGLYGDEFYAMCQEIINREKPNVVHNFGDPALVAGILAPCVKILTFDHRDDLLGKENYLRSYDAVVTVSKGYAYDLIDAEDRLSDLLRTCHTFAGITNGLWPGIYTGVSGESRIKHKRRLCAAHGLDSNNPLLLMQCRLIWQKGIEDVISAAYRIWESGANLLIYGQGKPEYEQQMKELHEQKVLTYIPRMASYRETMECMHGADFYLSPSRSEPCGLQPMKAALMGCVPIVTLEGGLRDNFNASCAIIVADGLEKAVSEAAEDLALYENAERVTAECDKLTVMLQTFYGGRDEIVKAANRCVADGVVITEENISARLYAAPFGHTDPDMIIRTGGFHRLSGYLPWESVYSELYVTDTLFPDLSKEEFNWACKWFEGIERTYGGNRETPKQLAVESVNSKTVPTKKEPPFAMKQEENNAERN